MQKGFSDWEVVGCYYAVYHIAFAMILSMGFFSKNHDATLCILIKYFSDVFNSKEIIILNQIQLTNKDVLFYVKAKEEREKASYSTEMNFNEEKTEFLNSQTIEFVNKCKEFLK